MPAVAIDSKTPCQPYGVKPPTSLKLALWNTVTRNATITRAITPSFHHTIGVLRRANARIPIRLIQQKIPRSTTARM